MPEWPLIGSKADDMHKKRRDCAIQQTITAQPSRYHPPLAHSTHDKKGHCGCAKPVPASTRLPATDLRSCCPDPSISPITVRIPLTALRPVSIRAAPIVPGLLPHINGEFTG